MHLPSKKWKFITIFVLLIFLVAMLCNTKQNLYRCYAKIIPHISDTYHTEKELIKPYFDEAFYKKNYADKLKETGLSAIDHFLLCGWKGEWSDNCDPNDWFNITLYNERLWPCKGNPFVDFLRQSPQKLPANAEVVEIYARKNEINRAWISIEGFLRQNKFRVRLILSASNFETVPACFRPMLPRGLDVRFEKNAIPSFYKSSFLKKSDEFSTIKYESFKKPADMPMLPMRKSNEYAYIFHNMHRYTKWKKEGRLNPFMLNFGKFCDEPLCMSPYGETEESFRAYMRRIASGFDFLFTSVELDTANSRIIPGFMASWINETEIPKEKTYSVSFMLSFSGKGFSSFLDDKSRNYYMRKIVWDREKEFALPTEFYIAIRSIDKYPKELRHRAMPTDSRKWICGSQFTVAIENSNQRNYLTEKLLSAFMSLVIPIYIGCPNVADYFDPRGMFIAKDVDEVLAICRSITPETYAKMLPYLKENKQKANALIGLYDRYLRNFYDKNMA